ncbi:fatty acid transporter- variant [Apiospora marii]|uniref:fatty acid transporter- variant n=1 Tax=Apiospora marii TaxID=335849 RepID=UPI003131F772
MSLTSTGAAIGTAAVAAYLDGKYHLRKDLWSPSPYWKLLNLQLLLKRKTWADKLTVYDTLEDHANSSTANNLFLMFEGRTWTYAQFFAALQPVGNWLINDLGIQRGEVVAIDSGNCPEYLLLMFALNGIGAVAALLNCNLTGKALVHCAKVASARYILTENHINQLVDPVEQDLAEVGCQVVPFDRYQIESLSDTNQIPRSRREKLDPSDVAVLLYTSGTTGLPKGVATARSHQLVVANGAFTKQVSLGPGDRMYTCLPLYHGAGYGLCILTCIASGATVVLSRKFSHRTFWPEVHESKATHIQYVGELCRYLVNAPPSPLDKGHNVRMAWGNGMRPDVWEAFRERFDIECINELYAASDGPGLTANANRGDFSRSAISVRGPVWHLKNWGFETRAIIDPETQDLVRGPDGFAVQAKPGEAGEMLYWSNPQSPAAASPYYNNPEATKKRYIQDVFKKGDLWFRSGDLMRLDTEGRLYFVDRLGDTFRWHSENVSTNEVSDMVGEFSQIAETNVYGVLVPRMDGRAGCAAVVVRDGGNASDVDWKALAAHCRERLPKYAVPLFIRVVKELEYTGNMKLRKEGLRTEGVDLDVIEKNAKAKGKEPDPMYWLPPGSDSYLPFRQTDLQELRGGRVKL